MDERALFTHLRTAFLAGFVAEGRPEVAVKRRFQSSPVTADTGPTLYMFKLFDQRYGSTKREEIWDADAGDYAHRETQFYETHVQASGIWRQGPEATGWTAQDVANFGAAIIQGDDTMAALRAAGLGVLRVTQVRNPFFSNGQDDFEGSPNFDFVITHEQVRVRRTPKATVGLAIQRI